jgi:hypothetical protein
MELLVLQHVAKVSLESEAGMTPAHSEINLSLDWYHL